MTGLLPRAESKFTGYIDTIINKLKTYLALFFAMMVR